MKEQDKINSIFALLCLSLLITVTNMVILFLRIPLFIPAANYGIVACVWLYRAYDSLIALGIGALWLGVMLYSLAKGIVKKRVFLSVILVYLVDLIIVVYLLINGWWWSAISIIIDIPIIGLALISRTRRT